jgi:hypothetical protein
MYLIKWSLLNIKIILKSSRIIKKSPRFINIKFENKIKKRFAKDFRSIIQNIIIQKK